MATFERCIGTCLFGRRMYETMAAWETPDSFPEPESAMLEFARVWQAPENAVYSNTLKAVDRV